MNSVKKLGIAVIGCGAISGLHLKAAAGSEWAELKAVADIEEERAKRTAETYSCDYYTDYQELLKRPDIDIVQLCTAHYQHAPMAVEALRAGKHVLTEKPMAENKASAQTMLKAAAENPNVQLGVIFQNRYNPAAQRMKEYVQSGALGKLVGMKGLVTWSRTAAYYNTEWKGKWATEGGGALINQSIHTLDLLQWLGGEIESVKGSMTNDSLEDVIEVEDTAHAYITFRSGVKAIFYATNAYIKNSPVEVELVFENGTLYQRGDDLYLEQNGQTTQLCEPVVNDLGEKSYWGVSHKVQIEDFYRHIRDKKPFWIDGAEGYKAFCLVMDIYESSRTGQRIYY